MTARETDISALLPDESEVAARQAALVAEVEPEGPRRRRPSGPRWRVAVATASVLTVSGGVAVAAGVFSADEVALEAGVGCYSEPRLQGPELAVTWLGSAADPVAECARLWEQGIVDHSKGSSSPQLVACSEPGAGVAVLPGGDTLCEQLGLRRLPADFAPSGREAARAHAAWSAHLTDMQELPPDRCRSPQRVADHVRQRLARTEYRDVEVEVRMGEACASYVDPEGAVIAVLTRSLAEVENAAAEASDPRPPELPGGP